MRAFKGKEGQGCLSQLSVGISRGAYIPGIHQHYSSVGINLGLNGLGNTSKQVLYQCGTWPRPVWLVPWRSVTALAELCAATAGLLTRLGASYYIFICYIIIEL